MIYIASYKTTLASGTYQFSSKAKAIRSIKDICRGNHDNGNRCAQSWVSVRTDSGEVVYEGFMLTGMKTFTDQTDFAKYNGIAKLFPAI